MTDNQKFCTHCGANLPDDCVFCPECGKNIDGSDSPYDRPREECCRGPVSQLGLVPTFILVYGMIAAAIGLMAAVSIGSLTEELWEELFDPDILPWDPQLIVAMRISAVCFTASGICALVSGVLARKMRRWGMCFASCLLSVLILMPMGFSLDVVIMIAIGAFMAYKLYKAKGSFMDRFL